MENAIIPYDQMKDMAQVIAKSGLFGMKTLEQAAALMLIAQAEGRHPASAAQDYHVIQGRPALKADAILARFQEAGGTVQWTQYTPEACSAKFSHPAGGTVTVEWTIKMAKDAGLAGKDTWRQYPRQMLRARVISEGVRTIYPRVVGGMYSPEEVQDFDTVPPEPRKVKAEPQPEIKKPAAAKPAPDIEDAQITVPEKAEPAKVEAPPAEPLTSAKAVADGIAMMRQAAIDAGLKSREEVFEAVSMEIGMDVKDWNQVPSQKHNRVIEFFRTMKASQEAAANGEEKNG